MTMRLDAADLRVIADKVEALQAVEGISVTQIAIDNGTPHYVWLDKDGAKYVIRGISDKAHKPTYTGALRGTER